MKVIDKKGFFLRHMGWFLEEYGLSPKIKRGEFYHCFKDIRTHYLYMGWLYAGGQTMWDNYNEDDVRNYHTKS